MRQKTRTVKLAAAAIVALVVVAAVAVADTRQVQLDSGLTLIAVADSWSDISAVSVMVDAGSRYDPDERGGLAQLTNEMLFEGTRDAAWEEIIDELDRLSIRHGALTSEDFAELYLTAYETEFDTALAWLAEFISRPAFDEERLDLEKETALRMLDREMNDAFTRNYHSLSELLFPGHPYSDVELEGPSELDVYHEGEDGFVEIGFLGPEVGGEDYAAVQVMISVLGDGSGSRLADRFGECGSTKLSVAGAFVSVRSEGIRLVAYASSDDIDATFHALNEEFERIRTVPASNVELERAKSRIATRSATTTETSKDKASAIARRHLLGLPPGFRETYFKRLDSVTADDVQRVARTYLVNPATVVERPGKPPRRGI
jgi:predicted Zn-dependent peptidase